MYGSRGISAVTSPLSVSDSREKSCLGRGVHLRLRHTIRDAKSNVNLRSSYNDTACPCVECLNLGVSKPEGHRSNELVGKGGSSVRRNLITFLEDCATLRSLVRHDTSHACKSACPTAPWVVVAVTGEFCCASALRYYSSGPS